MSTIVWTDRRSRARANEYQGSCHSCLKPVEAATGFLVSKGTPSGRPFVNGVLHKDCPLPAEYFFRAMSGSEKLLAEVRVLPDTEWSGNKAEVTAAAEAKPQPTKTELEQAAKAIVESVTDSFLAKVPDLVRNTMHEATRVVEFKQPAKAKSITVKDAHRILPNIVLALRAGVKPLIVGPAGSGKSTLALQCAKIIGKDFYCANSVAGKHELLGFRDAHGKPVHTDFYKAFKFGGLFLLDEMDNCNPQALVALNSAIANGFCEFAGEIVYAHKDFQIMGGANTFGRGADKRYVGRNKLDGSTLDRYVTFIMDYDEEAELAWAGNAEWTKWVQSVRAAVYAEEIDHLVSPRASIDGAKLLAVGMDRAMVEDSAVWKGLDNQQRVRITARLNRGV